MKKKLFLMIALLCAVVQGVWATEWDDVYGFDSRCRYQ